MDEPICWICGEVVDEGLDDWVDTPQGIAHDICYAEWLDDAPARAAGYYHDTRYDT